MNSNNQWTDVQAIAASLGLPGVIKIRGEAPAERPEALWSPSASYLETGTLGPIRASDIEWIDLARRVRTRQGLRIRPDIVDKTEMLVSALARAGMSYELREDAVRVFAPEASLGPSSSGGLCTSVRDAWGWTGIQPVEVVAENAFGNLLVRDDAGRYWRICPEDLSCQVVADSRDALDQLLEDAEFTIDWCMESLVEEARLRLGPLPEGRKYCLKIPGALGGTYGGDNLATLPLVELISASGAIAKQIAHLPDGAQIRLVAGEPD